MVLREERDRSMWDALATSVERATFLQSWAWGEGQRALGKIVRRYVLEKEGNPCFIAQAIEERRYGLIYWFVPGGPIAVSAKVDVDEWREAVDVLRNHLLCGRAIFLRIEPFLRVENVCPDEWIQRRSYNPAVHWMVDLRDKTEAQLLAEMEQKTRYNVRLGERQGVVTRLSTAREDVEVFLSLTHETGERHKIVVRNDHYLRTTFFAMVDSGIASLRVAEHEGEVLAASIEVAFGDTVTYLHGASSSKRHEIKAPQVLHWHAIQEAARRGSAWYDFGGCNPQELGQYEYKKSLEGVTRFKEGWGGERSAWVGTFVVPRSLWIGKILFRG